MLYALIGRPLGHSFSKKFFDKHFAEQGYKAEYQLCELAEIGELAKLLKKPNLMGLNVTSPYKEEVLSFVDYRSPEVERLGAANVLKIERGQGNEPFVKAYNTDVIGFQKSLEEVKGIKRALILGTGGAARSVALALENLGIQSIFVSRSAGQRCNTDNGIIPIAYDEVGEYLADCQLIVNATPVGFKADECPNFPYHLLNEQHLAYDLIYNPEETLFLKRARLRGARTKNGLEMLHLQALAAWAIWTD